MVLASHNAKKLAELRSLLAGMPLEVVGSAELGLREPDEPHATFLENALTKARHAARASGSAALADDSGLCVPALGGAPGVISAHYAGPVTAEAGSSDRESLRRLQDAANNRLLLERLRGVADRRARFVSVLVAIRSADDPEPLVAVGRWEGVVLEAPRGDGGFGYDPLMFIPEWGCTVADMEPQAKNQRSHRAMAAQRLRQMMRDAWHMAPAAP